MGIRIESIGVFHNVDGAIDNSIDLISRAASDCIDGSRHSRKDIDLIINASLYRNDYFVEPAFATLVQDKMEINHDIETCCVPRTFAFDLMNGAMGFFKACQVAGAMIVAGKAKSALIVSGDTLDIEISPHGASPEFCLTGAAMLLDKTDNDNTGFGPFYYKNFPEFQTAYQSSWFYETQTLSILFKKAPDLEEIYLKAVADTLSEFLDREGVRLDDFDLILPPQVSPSFVSRLKVVIGKGRRGYIDVARSDGDLFNASLPISMEYAMKNHFVSPGAKALVIGVTSGIQAGCTSYVF